MAKAKAICKCKTCGCTFEKTTTKINSKEALNWKNWAEEHFDECPQCYGKRKREEENNKQFTISVKIDPYRLNVILIASGNTYPHNEKLKEHGYKWGDEYDTDILNELSLNFIQKTWYKIIPIGIDDDALKNFQLKLQDEFNIIKQIGAIRKDEITQNDLNIANKVIVQKRKTET